MKYYFLLLFLSLLSCTNAKKGDQAKSNKVIVIQPLGNFKTDQAKKVLISAFDNPTITESAPILLRRFSIILSARYLFLGLL